MRAGEATLRLSWLGTFVETQHDDREAVVGMGEIDLMHDQELVISEGRLALEVGLSRRFGVSVMLPLRVIGTTIRYVDLAGSEVQLERPGIHHRNETVAGLGDPMVLGSVAARLGAWRLTGRAGATLPFARTERNPFAAGERAHQHIQLGSGTVNPVLAAEVSRTWGGWRVGAFALTQQALYENGKGYQAGDRYAGGVAVSRRVAQGWSVRGGVEAQGETAEQWRGTVHTDDGNRGRFDLIAGAAVAWAATERMGVELAVKVPVVTHVVGGQLKMPAIVEVGVSWAFGAGAASASGRAEEDEGHGHAHGDGHAHGGPAGDEPAAEGDAAAKAKALDRTGLDVVDVGPAGAAVELVAAPDKQITVYDFWAPWCGPCHELEPVLLALAREFPDRIAIRRLNVVDWESAAVQRYLLPGDHGIPHLKVLDVSGAVLLERSSDRRGPGPLVEAVRAVLEGRRPID